MYLMLLDMYRSELSQHGEPSEKPSDPPSDNGFWPESLRGDANSPRKNAEATKVANWRSQLQKSALLATASN